MERYRVGDKENLKLSEQLDAVCKGYERLHSENAKLREALASLVYVGTLTMNGRVMIDCGLERLQSARAALSVKES